MKISSPSFLWLSLLAGYFLVRHGMVDATLNRPADPVLEDEGIAPPPPDLKVKVGCYYYPWYAEDFHRDEEYLRDYLVPRQEPSMGEYDDRDPEVIKEHLRMSRQANCRVWIAAWFGPGKREDTTLVNNVFPIVEANDPDHRIAIHYETFARVRKKDKQNVFQLDDESGGTQVTHYFSIDGAPNDSSKPETSNDGVIDDMAHLCTNFFNSPNYYTIGGRPVIFMYLSRVLSDGKAKAGVDEEGNDFYWDGFDLLDAVVSEMRTGVMDACGMDPFIIGDHVFDVYNEAKHGPALDLLDGITTYDTYGQLDQDQKEQANGYADEEVEIHIQQHLAWKTAANNHGCAFIPGVTPGFNDRAVRLRTDSTGNEPKSLSRSIRPGALEGSLLAHLVEKSRPLLDPAGDFLIALTSLNEWHEDTQIEPTVVDRMSRALVIAADGTIQELEALETTNKAYHIWNSTRNGYLSPETYKATEPDTDLTEGLSYEAYYDLYLNIMRATTLAPFYTTDFQSPPPGATLQFGADYTPDPTIEGTQSVRLVRADTANPPVLRLNLGTLSSLYNFLVVEFMFYSERSEANEPLYVRCIDDQGGNLISEEKWEFGREFDQHRKAFFAVTECAISSVSESHNILLDFVYDSIDEKTSILIDLVKVTGLKEATDMSITPSPSKAPTKPPTKAPTKPPTKAPTKPPTKAPKKAPKKRLTKAPTAPPTPTTPVLTCQDFVVTIKTDSYPGDTAWELKDQAGLVIDSMSKNTYTVAGQENVHKWCLDPGSYTFVLKDDPYWKDGLCCSYAIDGFYRGTLDGVQIFGNAGAQAFQELQFPFQVVVASTSKSILV